jgi:tRNA threonylcarbamoyladenosine biosynthesis protein TsaB
LVAKTQNRFADPANKRFLRAVPLILALETATKLCSVALSRDGVVVAVRELESDALVHAEKLNVFVAEVMAKAGTTFSELDAVAVGIGPGSYTGLRIGLSAAKGLCFALDIPIIGISTLRTLVERAKEIGVPEELPQWPMVDARRMEVFTRPHDAAGVATGPSSPLVLDAEWVAAQAPCAVFGDGADKAAEFWSTRPDVTYVRGIRPTAAAMGVEAERRYTAEEFDDLAYLVPTYGKAANVNQPKKRSQ